MADLHEAPNLQVYNDPIVAEHYAALDYLTPCEKLLFGEFIKPDMAVLDLGVGGGRTTPYLSSIAGRYVGTDYADQMIGLCRRKFPGLEFKVTDAADLSGFGGETFDAVVMAFNGMDYVIPDSARKRSLSEVRRVLRKGGVLIFSSHNPRAVLVRPSWNPQRTEALARQLAGSVQPIFGFVKSILLGLRISAACFGAAAASARRLVQRLPWHAFWRGDGHRIDSAHGGLLTHYAVPDRVVTELKTAGFQLLRLQGDDFPRTSFPFVTDWYYYVFAKKDIPTVQQSCE